MSKKKNKSVLEPAEPKTIAIEPGAVALTIGGRKGDGDAGSAGSLFQGECNGCGQRLTGGIRR